jgi:hypothetical protein
MSEVVSGEIETNFFKFNTMENFNEHFRQRTLQFAKAYYYFSSTLHIS